MDESVAAILNWLAHFPLLADAQLAALTGVEPAALDLALAETRRRGWVGSVVVDGPAFGDGLRLRHLTAAGVQVAAAAAADPEVDEDLLGGAPVTGDGMKTPAPTPPGAVRRATAVRPVELALSREPAPWLPLADEERLARVTRVETAVGVAGFVAMLVDDLRELRTAAAPALGALASPAASVRAVPREATGSDDNGAGGGADALPVLVEAWSTPWTPRRPHAPLVALPAVEAFLRLRWGQRSAAASLAWDRAGAPPLHRRLRLADWRRVARETDDPPWGAWPPVVLVVCPELRVVAQWLDALAGHRALNQPPWPLALTTVAALGQDGPLAAGWWGPDGRRRPLLERLRWAADPAGAARGAGVASPSRRTHALAAPAPPTALAYPDAGRNRSRVPPSSSCPALLPAAASVATTVAVRPVALGAWAQGIVRTPERYDRLREGERWAALSLGLSPTQQTLLLWVAHHPLLTSTHLALLLERPERAVAHLLRGLVARGLVAPGGALVAGEPAGARLVLTMAGARYLAARDGVPWRRYLGGGVLAVDDTAPAADSWDRPGTGITPRGAGGRTDQVRQPAGRGAGSGSDADRAAPASSLPEAARVRLADLRRHPEHTAGVQTLVLALVREAAARRAQGEHVRVLAWLSTAEGQEWFRYGGRAWHILPDARVRLRADGADFDLLLEWDRGVVRRRDYARKLASYAAFFADRPGTPAESVRLVVVTTETAAERVQAELAIAARTAPRLRKASRVLPMSALRTGQLIAGVR